MVRALAEPTFEAFIQAAFYNTVEFLGAKEHPASCFTLTGSLSCGVDTEPAKALMLDIRLRNEAVLKARLLKARRAGEFPKKRTSTTIPAIFRRYSVASRCKRRMVPLEHSSNAPLNWL